MNKVFFPFRAAAPGPAIRAGLLAGAVAALPMAAWFLISDMMSAFGIGAVGTALALVGLAMAGGAITSAWLARWRVGKAFEVICAQARDAYFLADADCVLLGMNPAATRIIATLRPNHPPARPGALLADALRAWTEDADAVVYRLARQSAVTWGNPEMLTGAAPGALAVRQVGQGVFLWRIEAPQTWFPPVQPDDRLTVLDLDADGRIVNSGDMPALAPETLQDIETAAAAAIAAGQSTAQVIMPGGAQATMVIAVAPTGLARLFVVIQPDTRDAMLTRLLEDLPVALVRMGADGTVISVNAAGRKLLGARAVSGAPLEKLVEGFGRPISAQVRDAALSRGGGRLEQARGVVEGRDVFLQIALTKAPDDERGELIAVLSDATELRTLEQQFVQSQKMQAVGQMAGGVAHDFNNLLTAIIGHCDLLMLRTDPAQPAFADLTQIKQNANRAAALVRQLLAFSRKQTLKPKPANLTDTLNELSHLLNRLLGERVQVELDHAFDLWPVWIDERQFEQVIVNLAVNARDAMPRGGTVTVSSRNMVLSEVWSRDRAAVSPGDYVCITVSDTGAGMDEATKAKVFEPFFTTKRQGEGTGLGLSTAYGIVKQMEGFIFVDSELGKGTVFTILLPRMIDAPVIEAEAAPNPAGDLTGSGSILLVEDEAPVRAFAARALKLRGYDVIEADCAEAALMILEDETMRVDLMISDVVMPGQDGPAWVRTARKARPDVAVIFISGYAEAVFRNGVEDIENYTFLAKPFMLDELAAAVKSALLGEHLTKGAKT